MNKTNTDDIFIRNATIALLEVLSTELFFEQVVNGKTEEIRVGFMASAGTSEQFMKDFFLGIPENICPDIPKAEGNFEKLPFGVLTVPPQIQIQTKDLTNKFVRANYVKKETDDNGVIKGVGYNSRLLALPMTITYKIEIRVATMNQLLKVAESVIDTFFQTRVKYFEFKGIRIPAMIKFPEQYDIRKDQQFDFSTQDNIASLKFIVSIDTTYPSYDKSSKVRLDNTIERYNTAVKEESTDRVIGDLNGETTDQNSL